MSSLYKMLFFSSMTLGILITITSYTWLGMWIGLEMNLLSFIPLMSNNKNILTNESSIKYFIIQTIASTIFLMMISSSYSMMFNPNLSSTMMNLAMSIKLGMAPFHFWFSQVIEGLSWMNSIILMSIQKISPMIIISYNMNINFIILVIFTSSLVSGVLGLNQISLRKIMVYSSINHMSWMLMTLTFSTSIWLIYITIYMILSVFLMLMFNFYNIYFLHQMFNLSPQNLNFKALTFLSFLNMGGLPPFLGFFPKWISINLFVSNKLIFLTLFMVIMNLVTLYFYTRLFSMNFLFKNSISNNFLFMKTNKSSLSIFLVLNSLISMTLIFNFT